MILLPALLRKIETIRIEILHTVSTILMSTYQTLCLWVLPFLLLLLLMKINTSIMYKPHLLSSALLQNPRNHPCFFFFGFVLFLLQHKRVSPPYLIFPISITACCYFSLLKKKKWPYFLCSSHFTLLFVYNRAPQRSCLYCLCPMLSC